MPFELEGGAGGGAGPMDWLFGPGGPLSLENSPAAGDGFSGGGGGRSGGAGAGGTAPFGGGGMIPYPGGSGGTIPEILRGVALATGVRTTLRGVIALVKRVGVNMAATALGVDGPTMLRLVGAATAKASRRRARGITGRQLQNAKRVCRTMASFQKQLSGACCSSARRSFPARKKSKR